MPLIPRSFRARLFALALWLVLPAAQAVIVTGTGPAGERLTRPRRTRLAATPGRRLPFRAAA